MKKLVQFLLKKFGYQIYPIEAIKKNQEKEIQEFSKENLLKTCFEVFKSAGFSPKHIIDVGANHGTWTRETLKYFPDSYYTLIEPQPWMKDSIRDLLDNNNKIELLSIGVGKKQGKFNFTIVDRDDSCSFRFTDEEAKANGFKQIEIEVNTLNKVIANSQFPFPDLIKIDAEGLDLEVLEGASELFSKVEVFMVEGSVVCKALENSALKIINYMDTKGYTLFDITDMNRPFTRKVLWLVELVFVKKNGIIDSKKWI